jgi:hypothetical protein
MKSQLKQALTANILQEAKSPAGATQQRGLREIRDQVITNLGLEYGELSGHPLDTGFTAMNLVHTYKL